MEKMEKHFRCHCLKASCIYRGFWEKKKKKMKVIWLGVRMNASFVRRHKVGICKHAWPMVGRESGAGQKPDKKGMCEEVWGEGVTQGIACDGGRLQTARRARKIWRRSVTESVGGRELELNRDAFWMSHDGRQGLMRITEKNCLISPTSFSWILLKEYV